VHCERQHPTGKSPSGTCPAFVHRHTTIRCCLARSAARTERLTGVLTLQEQKLAAGHLENSHFATAAASDRRKPNRRLNLITGQAHHPLNAAEFGNWYCVRCNEAGLRHCSVQPLRKAGATIAAENRATVRELMSVFGWLTMKEAEGYTRSVERRKLAEAAIPLLFG
jgi:hypothetical protein